MTIYLSNEEIKKIIRALGKNDPLSKRLDKKINRVKGPKADLSFMADKWLSDIVYRKDIHAFSGGVFSEHYMSNLDSQGKGPSGKIRINKKIAYRIRPLIEWMENISEVLPPTTTG